MSKFRTLQRHLMQHNKRLVLFAEELFNYPHNDLDFYKEWEKEDQREKSMALKRLAQFINKKR